MQSLLYHVCQVYMSRCLSRVYVTLSRLSVRAGIAAGGLCITYLGNDEFRHYATTGEAVVDVNGAEKFCESGYVVVAPYAWSMADKQAFTHEFMSDGKHVRVSASFRERILTPISGSGGRLLKAFTSRLETDLE